MLQSSLLSDPAYTLVYTLDIIGPETSSTALFSGSEYWPYGLCRHVYYRDPSYYESQYTKSYTHREVGSLRVRVAGWCYGLCTHIIPMFDVHEAQWLDLSRLT